MASQAFGEAVLVRGRTSPKTPNKNKTMEVKNYRRKKRRDLEQDRMRTRSEYLRQKSNCWKARLGQADLIRQIIL